MYKYIYIYIYIKPKKAKKGPGGSRGGSAPQDPPAGNFDIKTIRKKIRKNRFFDMGPIWGPWGPMGPHKNHKLLCLPLSPFLASAVFWLKWREAEGFSQSLAFRRCRDTYRNTEIQNQPARRGEGDRARSPAKYQYIRNSKRSKNLETEIGVVAGGA